MGKTYWPVLLILLSNIFYHITTKSTPSGANPFLSLAHSYLLAAMISIGFVLCIAGLIFINRTCVGHYLR